MPLSWRQACNQYLNCRGDASPHQDLAFPDRDSVVPRRNLSASPSRFSNFHTKRKISGYLDKKVVGDGNHYKTSAEVSTILRRRPFFFGPRLILVTNSRNPVLISAKTFF